MAVEPRFRMQVRSLVVKDGRAKALNDALTPADRPVFNAYLASVVAVLLVPRFPRGCDLVQAAGLSESVAQAHRSERRPVNVFVVDEVLRTVYGLPSLFDPVPVPPGAVSTAGAALLRYLANTDPQVAVDIDRILDEAEAVFDGLR